MIIMVCTRLHEAVSALVGSDCREEVESRTTLKILVKNLTPTLKKRWGLFVIDKLPDIPTAADFDKWLGKAPRFAMDNFSAETPQRAFEWKREFRSKAASNVHAITRHQRPLRQTQHQQSNKRADVFDV